MEFQLFFKCSGKNLNVKIALRYTLKMVLFTWFVFMLGLIVLDKIVNLICS